MDEFLKLLVTAGPAGVLTFMFLIWDLKKGKLFNDSITQLAQAVARMQESLAARPCLWETTAQRLVEQMQELIQEAAKAALILATKQQQP